MPGMMKKAAPKPTATKSAAPKLERNFKEMPLERKFVAMSKPKATPTPKPSPSTLAQRSAAAEAELKKLMKQGKVKDILKTKDALAKKYGVRPSGMTR
jgi:hypothetical protein